MSRYAKLLPMCALALLSSGGLAGEARAARLFGLNIHQSSDVGPAVTQRCKGTIVRVDFNWFQAQPSETTWDWALFDDLVDKVRARGLTVLAVLSYTPAWASAGDVDGKRHDNDVPKPGYYEKFVTETVKRYAGKIDHYELWNEPNLGEFFEGTPQQYVDLILKPGAAAVHAACPGCKTLGPDVATVGGKYDIWMETTLSQAKDSIDIVTGHVYADFAKVPTDTSFFSKLENHRILKLGDATLYEDPLSLRESMVKFGAGSKPFWLTETGKTAKFGDAKAMDAQAVYVRHVLEAMLSRPWWTATVFYEAFDEPGTTYDWGFSLRDPAVPDGYRLKPVCDVLAKAVANQPLFGGTGSDCNDGLDNEGDGLIDYPQDPDCTSEKTFSEGAPPVVDAGPDDDAGSSDDAGPSEAGAEDMKGGCGCHATGDAASSIATLSLVLGALLVLRRRNR